MLPHRVCAGDLVGTGGRGRAAVEQDHVDVLQAGRQAAGEVERWGQEQEEAAQRAGELTASSASVTVKFQLITSMNHHCYEPFCSSNHVYYASGSH